MDRDPSAMKTAGPLGKSPLSFWQALNLFPPLLVGPSLLKGDSDILLTVFSFQFSSLREATPFEEEQAGYFYPVIRTAKYVLLPQNCPP